MAEEAQAGTAEVSADWATLLLQVAALDSPADSADAERFAGAAARALAGFSAEPQKLPRRPQLLPQLLGALNDDETSARQFAALISRDPALAGSLLRVANSPVYRLQALPVESLDRAVALVGTQGLRQLVAVALMQPVMRGEGGMFGRMPDLVWEHTQRTSQEIARAWRGRLADDVFAAQLLALIQGLGAIVVLRTLGQVAAAQGTGLPPDALTAGLLKQWSPRIGQLVAREWELSERLQQALRELADPAQHQGSLARLLARTSSAAAASMREGHEHEPLAQDA